MSWATWASLDDEHPWETWVSLDDVHRSIAAKETVIYGPALVYVVNFDSSFPYPRKFLYPACSKVVGYKKVCGKSLESEAVCHRDGGYMDMYRFKLILVDAVHGCKPLLAHVWDPEGFTFLRLGASDFRKCTEAEQIAYVRELTLRTPKCTVYLNLHEGVVSLQNLSIMYPWPNVSFPPSLHIGGYRSATAELCSNLPRSSIISYYNWTPLGSASAYYVPTQAGSSIAYYIPTPSGSSIAYTSTPSSSSTSRTQTPSLSSHSYDPLPSGSASACTPTSLDSYIASVATPLGSSCPSKPSRPGTSIADTPTRRKRVGKHLQEKLVELLDVLKDTNLEDELEIDESVAMADEGGDIPATEISFDVQEQRGNL